MKTGKRALLLIALQSALVLLLAGLHLIAIGLGRYSHMQAPPVGDKLVGQSENPIAFMRKFEFLGAYDLDGRIFSTGHLRGRWTLVVFVSTDCGLCGNATQFLKAGRFKVGSETLQTVFVMAASSARAARLWSRLLPHWMRQAGDVLYTPPGADLLSYCRTPGITYPTAILLDGQQRIRYWQHGFTRDPYSPDGDHLKGALERANAAAGCGGYLDADKLVPRIPQSQRSPSASALGRLGAVRAGASAGRELLVAVFLSGDASRDEARIRSVSRFRSAPSIRIVFIVPTHQSSLQAAGTSLSYCSGFPVIPDADHSLAQTFGVARRPAAVVVDGNTVVYNDSNPANGRGGQSFENDMCWMLLGWKACWEDH